MLSCVKQHINHEDKVLLSNKAAFPGQVSKKKPQLSNQCLGIETAQHLSGAGQWDRVPSSRGRFVLLFGLTHLQAAEFLLT